MRVADFYCGAGGFSEGFRQAGFDVCFAVDKWAPAVNTYRANKPQCNVMLDDVIRISRLPDEEFHTLVPDTEVIIGSPPCVAFSNSNKSGQGDKTLGLELLKAYLRIVARKKYKHDSILRYWVLENVPNIRKYLQDQRFAFKNERLPLSFAPLRNTLISQNFFEINRDNLKTVFYIDTKYEKLISSFCQQRKKTIGIEQLKKQLEANSEAGEKAEIFVLQYEKKRIGKHPLVEKIRIISDIDVCAGYDIVSFNSNDSDDYDRFIEVKAVSNPKGFYWSINELNTAKLKGKRYYLYLIDLQKVSDENYIPTIINDPASVLFDSDEWFVEPQSFHIWHV